eukprot:TRINITY_DN10056_c0_g1_i1.p1 TRINITY_DN10056_c0_g1~~TRINITY_DN10056_c0_g1_i1.p1  ORF type:complete len:267 (-),score=36.24 TRINITY_DN10056_c0_g1_i1:54-854(-)
MPAKRTRVQSPAKGETTPSKRVVTQPQKSWDEIVKKTWKLYKTGKLTGYDTAPVSLRALTRDLVTAFRSNTEGDDQPTITIDALPQGAIHIEITIAQKPTVAVLVQSESGEALLIMRGLAKVADDLRSWFENKYQTHIAAMTLSAFMLHTLAQKWVVDTSTITTKVEFSFGWPIGAEGAKSMKITLDNVVAARLAELDNGILSGLRKHILDAMHIDLGGLPLTSIATAAAMVSVEGRLKILSADAVQGVIQDVLSLETTDLLQLRT